MFAPNSAHRSQVTPAKRGRGNKFQAPVEEQQTIPRERHAAMSWAQRLKRVFNIDIETCSACGGAVEIIACIEDPGVIKKILDHLDRNTPCTEPSRLPPCSTDPPGPTMSSQSRLPENSAGYRSARRLKKKAQARKNTRHRSVTVPGSNTHA